MNNLTAAVQYLYGQGLITKDKDIADKTGYNKATVSSYISGRTRPSSEFIDKFQSAFRINLDDFAPGGEKEIIQQPDAVMQILDNVRMQRAEHITNRQLLIEVLAATTSRSVSEVQLMAERLLSHNMEKLAV